MSKFCVNVNEVKDFGNGNEIYYEYYNNGCIKSLTSYQNGKLHGDLKSFYPNGSLRSKCCYIHNEIRGTYKTWYPSKDSHIGILRSERTRESHYRKWDMNGNITD